MSRLYASFAMAAVSAIAMLAPETGSGSNPTVQPPAPDPAASEPAKPLDPQTSKASKASEPQAQAQAAGRSSRRTHIVWAAAGHPTFAPGAILTATEDEAEALRAAGRARKASPEEVKALPKGHTVPEFG